jgi:ADP-heptose:LPS heptosyltransferase
MKRILLIQLKRIGDLLLTAPAVHELRAQQPQAELVIVVPSACEEIARAMPVHQVLAYQPRRPNLPVWSSISTSAWDACYDFSGTDRSALMTGLSRAPQRIGYARFAQARVRAHAYSALCDASVRELHTVDFHRALLGLPLGLAVAPDSLQFPALNMQLPPRYALVHLGTAREEKFWPVERWAETITHLVQQRQLPVILTGTGTGLEEPHLQRLHSLLSCPVVDLTGKLSLMQTGSVLAHSSLALGVDSMAMHMASLARVPQIVLFGPTNPFHWRPLQPHAHVLTPGRDAPTVDFKPKAKGSSMTGISVQSVLSAMDVLLGAR